MQVVGELPHRPAEQPPARGDGLVPVAAQVQPQRQDREHPRAVHLLREEVGEDGTASVTVVSGRRDVQRRQRPPGQQPGDQPDPHARDEGDEEPDRHPSRGDVAAHDGGDGRAVEHEGGGVVEHPLALEHRDEPVGEPQPAGHGRGGHRVGGRDDHPEHPRRTPAQSGEVGDPGGRAPR